MKSRTFKSQASSSRAFTGQGSAFGTPASFTTSSSSISYLAEQPDLSLLSDANLVVGFKNLQKRDSTTKSKALEDLQRYVIAQQEQSADIDDHFLDAWVKVFPRASIDTSRRVRQLSQTLNGRVAALSGKRVVNHMPRIVPCWLMGIHDTDNAVARAADSSFQLVFPTIEKRTQVKRLYQDALLSFCSNLVDTETPRTLSDERNTTPDDSNAVYFRSVANVISAVADAVNCLDEADLKKHRQSYDRIASSEKLWTLISAQDPTVRRAVAQLAIVFRHRLHDSLISSMRDLARAFLSKSAMREQMGSSNDYIQALLAVSRSCPEIWTDETMSKVKPEDRLEQLVKYGSHSGPPAFWSHMAELIDELPESSLPSRLDRANSVFNTMQRGFSRREEPQSNTAIAFASYFKLMRRVAALLPPEESHQLLMHMAYPILRQYVEPSADTSHWSVAQTQESKVVSMALDLPGIYACLESGWGLLGTTLLDKIKTSLPEQSKDYDLSQSAAESHAKRFFSLEADIWQRRLSSSVREVILSTRTSVVSECLELLMARGGKPYGAAGCIVATLTLGTAWNDVFHSSAVAALDSFLLSGIPQIFFSPSQSRLVAILYESHERDVFRSSWHALVDSVLNMPDTSAKLRAVEQIVCSPRRPDLFEDPRKRADLQAYLLKESHNTLVSGHNADFLNRLISRSSSLLSTDSLDALLSDMTKGLLNEGHATQALQGLDAVQRADAEFLRRFSTTREGEALLPNLLRVQESTEDAEPGPARQLSRTLATMLSSAEVADRPDAPGLSALRQGLKAADSDSLSTDTLVDLAIRFQEQQTDEKLSPSLLPSPDMWSDSLKPFLTVAPPNSFAITDVLGGMVFLVQPDRTSSPDASVFEYDIDGFSPPLRMGMYITSLFNRRAGRILDKVQDRVRLDICRCLALTAQLVNDKLSDSSANHIYNSQTTKVDDILVSFVSESFKALQNNLQIDTDAGEASELRSEALRETLLELALSSSPESFHHGRLFASLTSQAGDLPGSRVYSSPNLETGMQKWRGSRDGFAFAAYLSGFKMPLLETPTLRRFLNESFASLTGQKSPERTNESLRNMAIMNLILCEWDSEVELLPKQRLVFFVQAVVGWLQNDQLQAPLKSETCKSLSYVLPWMSDIYGQHWFDILDFLKDSWTNSTLGSTLSPVDIALTHASLRLFTVIRSMSLDPEANDDLKDAWVAAVPGLANGLLNLLEIFGSHPDEMDQALRIVNESLSRQVTALPIHEVRDVNTIYGLLGTTSRSVQQAAYHILHRKIPKAQEQVSLDTVLDKSVAKLPEELLSLVTSPPMFDPSLAIDFDRLMPSSLFTYLSGWLLIFDHFKNSSEKVKRDYIAQVKEGGYLTDLLDFMFTFLGHAKGRPIDASKFDATAYSFDIEPSPIKDVQWLLIHLYHLSLKRMSSLTKAWWIDCKSRQIRTQVEPWTEKHFSPAVIADVLTATGDWARTQDASAEDALIIKTNPRTREVTASKEIDEQLLTMAIRLPTNFPLGQVAVEGVNRVAVDERRWRSWLLNTQGVITFSDNSITEGLQAFRRNVVGQLKGQTECAICYSIVGQDKQLPTKKCGTCNNLFHGSCLYKWFKSSNSSSCPLCRTSFNYT